MEPKKEKLLTLNEIQQYLKIPKSTLYKLSENGQIPSCKIGKQLRFRKSSIDRWLSEKENSSITIPDKISSARPKFILLIDDDPLVLKAVAKFLKIYGFNVEPAQNGEEAIEKIGKRNFDLVITDIRMPGIDGIETIKRIRQLQANSSRPGIPEIIITGYADSEAERQAGGLGIHDFIYKPFAITDFIKTVKSKLEFDIDTN